MDAEAAQHFPVLGDSWVMAFRGLVSAIDTSGTDTVPYFLLPALGGNTALRGYPTWRFRDRNRILLTGEYRWMAGPFIDMALFLDAGKVTARARDLDLRDLKRSYGIGVRLHTATETVVRVELARTSTEGTGWLLSFSQIF
jgi:outer membrane protein assembly factor BamA